ncbi:MAG: hypothetical protein HY905_17225 [Deltaproteobacteria bacterium]|nr:hypothetical protein [Deltaproteobacteria bacterium]
MASGNKCTKCGAENAAGAARCAGCGAELAAAAAPAPSQESMYGFDALNKPSISWAAAGLGAAIIIGLQVVVGLALVPLLSTSMLGGRSPNLVGFWSAMILIVVAVYFAAGFVLGRYSKGYLVREPVLAALVAAPANWLLEHFVYRNRGVSTAMLVASAVLCLGIAYLGGMAGEQVQQKERERKRAAAAARK